jgi:hypothetical protein
MRGWMTSGLEQTWDVVDVLTVSTPSYFQPKLGPEMDDSGQIMNIGPLSGDVVTRTKSDNCSPFENYMLTAINKRPLTNKHQTYEIKAEMKYVLIKKTTTP